MIVFATLAWAQSDGAGRAFYGPMEAVGDGRYRMNPAKPIGDAEGAPPLAPHRIGRPYFEQGLTHVLVTGNDGALGWMGVHAGDWSLVDAVGAHREPPLPWVPTESLPGLAWMQDDGVFAVLPLRLVLADAALEGQLQVRANGVLTFALDDRELSLQLDPSGTRGRELKAVLHGAGADLSLVGGVYDGRLSLWPVGPWLPDLAALDRALASRCPLEVHAARRWTHEGRTSVFTMPLDAWRHGRPMTLAGDGPTLEGGVWGGTTDSVGVAFGTTQGLEIQGVSLPSITPTLATRSGPPGAQLSVASLAMLDPSARFSLTGSTRNNTVPGVPVTAGRATLTVTESVDGCP